MFLKVGGDDVMWVRWSAGGGLEFGGGGSLMLIWVIGQGVRGFLWVGGRLERGGCRLVDGREGDGFYQVGHWRCFLSRSSLFCGSLMLLALYQEWSLSVWC